MIRLELAEVRAQTDLSPQPYDRWVDPDGEIKAEFRRDGDGFHLRFLDEADFQITSNGQGVIAWPAPGSTEQTAQNLFHNAILPLLTNYSGGLCLHGSAVVIDGRAAAFLGPSRSGKTTLAGAFAKSDAPFLTEDVVELERRESDYWVQPKATALRLFNDSAEFLLGSQDHWIEAEDKQAVSVPEQLPFAQEVAGLDAIFVLASAEPEKVSITRLSPLSALTHLIPHSFILDVEDKPRLKAHFSRLVDLSQDVPCYALDYRRDYRELEHVIEAVRAVRSR